MYTRAGAIVALSLVAVLMISCTPYAVHTTARPLPYGETSRTTIFTIVPNGVQFDSTLPGAAMPSLDFEYRRGTGDRSDIGLRLNSMSGIIGTVRHRLDGPYNKGGIATAVLLGAGFVNLGQHAHFEATLISSGPPGHDLTPYGGLRVIQIAPLTRIAVHDTPAAGAFGGVKYAANGFGLGFELGVFHDKSALRIRQGDVVVVPSISISGLGQLFSRGGVPRRSSK